MNGDNPIVFDEIQLAYKTVKVSRSVFIVSVVLDTFHDESIIEIHAVQWYFEIWSIVLQTKNHNIWVHLKIAGIVAYESNELIIGISF